MVGWMGGKGHRLAEPGRMVPDGHPVVAGADVDRQRPAAQIGDGGGRQGAVLHPVGAVEGVNFELPNARFTSTAGPLCRRFGTLDRPARPSSKMATRLAP